MKTKGALLALAALGGTAVIGTLAIAPVSLARAEVPQDLNRSLDRITRDGRFRVRIEPAESPIPLHRIHRWSVAITDGEGRPVDGATIAIDGGMPQHGHGLPTKPVAMPDGAAGSYAINGMKFSMDGWWELKLAITANGVTDGVTFNIVL